MRKLIKYLYRYWPYALLIAGLIFLAYSLSKAEWSDFAMVVGAPFLTIFVVLVLYKPWLGMIALFIINYFLLSVLRYVHISGISVIMDIFLLFLLVCTIINSLARNDIPWERAKNKLLYLSLIWMTYVALELFNPSAMFSAWIYNRGSIYNFPFLVVLTSVLFTKVKHIKTFLFVLSVLTLVSVAKALMQKYRGFDSYELEWLNNGGASTHIIASGVRYFSIFSDAGNFGSNMGFAAVVYMILSLYLKNGVLRIYYFCVSLLAAYAMMLSGTRGAMIVPLGGMVMFIILNKNIRQIVGGAIVLLIVYVFFAHTWLLNSNQQIRRMRTAFRPSQDASFNVRVENQKRLASYMKHKPFGEGLGLAGVENQRFSYRFTTMIPTDSHFVNVWVQFGIVGLCLHLAILLFIIVYSGYLIIFRIKNRELRGMLIAVNCALFGIMLSAYGNNFFLQYPTGYMVYICQTFLMLGESYDKELTENKELIDNKEHQQLQTSVIL